jgi:transcriptional regulator GlxA family with amidase domain
MVSDQVMLDALHGESGRRYQSRSLSEMTKMWHFLPMHRVAFIIYPGFELLDTSEPASVFNSANRSLDQSGKPPLYQIDMVSAAGGPVASSSGVVVLTRGVDKLSGEIIDTVLIAGAEREHLLRAMADPCLRKWLPQVTARSRRFGSVCSGAFVLAALGLLDGCRIAIHWDACAALCRRLSLRHRRS